MLTTQPLPRYDRSQTYRWNYDHAPAAPQHGAESAAAREWTFCGRAVNSPLGIAAGPLLNGRWILYYAALGFDVLTYKTVRSAHRECYPLPNLQPIDCQTLASSGRELRATDRMEGSWAVSFGMPSMSPDIWRADVEWTRSRLPRGKLLSVSVVATAQPDWSLDDLANDFARCARWAAESGADCVEANFSCPNVSTCDGQLYQQPAAAGLVAQRLREAIGRTPLILKVGFITDEHLPVQLLDAVAPFADALAMTNCIAATLRRVDGEFLFGGQQRGIGGAAIRSASIDQVRRFTEVVRERGYPTKLIGVGGISNATHVEEYLAAGAQAVHLATAAMVDPHVGQRIRRELESSRS